MAKVTFQTVSSNNSIYTVDTINKTIEGGVLNEPAHYISKDPTFLAGNRVMLDLTDDRSITTSPIKKVLGIAKDEPALENNLNNQMEFMR